jgi:hypothetical protein
MRLRFGEILHYRGSYLRSLPDREGEVCEGGPADRDQKRKLDCRYGAVGLPIFTEDIEPFSRLVDGGMKKAGRLLRWAWSGGMLVLYMDLNR